MHIIQRARTAQRLWGDPCRCSAPGVPALGSLAPKSLPAFPCSTLMPLQAVSHAPSSTGFQLDLTNRSTNKRLKGRRKEETRKLSAKAMHHHWPQLTVDRQAKFHYWPNSHPNPWALLKFHLLPLSLQIGLDQLLIYYLWNMYYLLDCLSLP